MVGVLRFGVHRRPAEKCRSRTGLRIRKDGDPVLGEVIADGFDEGRSECESDGAGRSEEGRSPARRGTRSANVTATAMAPPHASSGEAPPPRGRGSAPPDEGRPKDEETSESQHRRRVLRGLAGPAFEAEPNGQNEDQEEQLPEGEDWLNLGELPEVRRDRLEQEREDHEDESEQPESPGGST